MGVVCIACDHMGKAHRKQLVRRALRRIAEASEQASLIELEDITLGEPMRSKTRILLHCRVALRVSDDGNIAIVRDPVERRSDLAAARVKAKLRQQIA